jgi:fused signal recognition particle receptor
VVFRLFRRKEKTQDALAKTRRGWGGGIAELLRRGSVSDDALWEKMEDALVSADVGVDTTVELVARVRQRARDERANDSGRVVELFKEEMSLLLHIDGDGASEDAGSEIQAVRPYVVLVVGVNGVGKTTSIAKLAHHYGQAGQRVVIAAADTFRAAAVEQLQVWGERLGVDVVAHQRGADPGAVAYDAYQAALSRDADILMVDTAGRIHTKANLMDELQKVRRVLSRLEASAPHQTMLVLDATTGQNGLAQARAFRDVVGVDGVFLAKLDSSAKGGIVVAIARELSLPVLFIGTGEGLDEISLFDAGDFVEALFNEQDELGQTTAPQG